MRKYLKKPTSLSRRLKIKSIDVEDERVIWNFGNTGHPGFFDALNTKLTITASGQVTISLRFVSLNKRSVTMHPGFRVVIKDRQNNVLVDWLSGTQPFTCNTNVDYTKSATFPGIFDRIFYGNILGTQFNYKNC